MPRPIFVKPHQHYWDCGNDECMKTHSASYTDFFKMVELAKFDTCHPEEIDWQSDNIYICIYFSFPWYDGKPATEFPTDRKCKMILWDLERQRDAVDKRYDEIWVSDRWLAAIYPGAKFVPIGTDWRLRNGQVSASKKFDFIHLSYITDRRKQVIEYLMKEGLTIAPNAWGEVRHNLLLQSSFMLNVHQDDLPIIEPLRLAVASAYAMPILTELANDYSPYEVDTEMKIPIELKLVWLKPLYPADHMFGNYVMKALEPPKRKKR